MAHRKWSLRASRLHWCAQLRLKVFKHPELWSLKNLRGNSCECQANQGWGYSFALKLLKITTLGRERIYLWVWSWQEDAPNNHYERSKNCGCQCRRCFRRVFLSLWYCGYLYGHECDGTRSYRIINWNHRYAGCSLDWNSVVAHRRSDLAWDFNSKAQGERNFDYRCELVCPCWHEFFIQFFGSIPKAKGYFLRWRLWRLL